MKRSTFLLISAVLAFVFGGMLFFFSHAGAKGFGFEYTPQIGSLLKGIGGLIIGSGAINFLMRNNEDAGAIRALLLTNIITHLFGISADILGIFDGAITISNIIPAQITHLFIGIGSLIYLSKLKTIKFP